MKSLLGFLWKESLGGAAGPRRLQPKGRSQGSSLAVVHYFVSSHSAHRKVHKEPLALLLLLLFLLWWRWSLPPSPGVSLGEAWEGAEGEGRPGVRSRVENSWMLPAGAQRMFRAHIRCDQWCHFFCPGYEIPSAAQWVHSLFSVMQYSHMQINTFSTIRASALKRNKGVVSFPKTLAVSSETQGESLAETTQRGKIMHHYF